MGAESDYRLGLGRQQDGREGTDIEGLAGIVLR